MKFWKLNPTFWSYYESFISELEYVDSQLKDLDSENVCTDYTIHKQNKNAALYSYIDVEWKVLWGKWYTLYYGLLDFLRYENFILFDIDKIIEAYGLALGDNNFDWNGNYFRRIFLSTLTRKEKI